MALLIGLILLIEIILFFVNYSPHTFLIGWDNVTPEFNTSINLNRELFGVWADYRGLGLANGMAEIANLFHTIYIAILSIFFNISDLRYIFIIFLHLSGGVGIFMLIRMLTRNLNASFIGALFYMFNIGVIQMFFAPLETFAFHFAALPIGAFFITKTLENTNRKNLFFVFLTSLFFSPQSFVPTFFIVYLILVGALFLFHLTKEKAYKKIFTIIMVIIMSNAFWGLPYAYSSLTNAKVIADSKINQMSTEDDLLKNKAFGNLKSVALMQGFLLDYTDSQPKGNNDFIMPAWKEHVDKLPFVIFGFSLFILAVAGGILAIRRKERRFYPFVFMFIFSFLMLGNDIPVLSSIFGFFSNFIPYFSQLFRFTFTKFSILYAFSFSILLAYTLSWILEKERFKYASFILPLIFLTILFYLSFPTFKGQFFYQNLRIKVPDEYFKLIDYFRKEENGRIATLPQPSYWGWTYTNWGYRGSGFLWYGIPQPTLDGAFLPWSKENENYYWEVSYAINSANQRYFESVLNKYDVDWIVLDHNIISQYSSKATSIENLEKLIKGSRKLTLAKTFRGIEVYKVNGSNQNNFVSIEQNLPNINSYNWNSLDSAYIENADYITNPKSSEQIFYPLRSLFTGREQKDLEFGISDKGHYFLLSTIIPTNIVGGKLILPKIFSEEALEINENLEQILKLPQFYLDNELIPAHLEETTTLNESSSSGNKILLPYILKGNFEVRIPKIEGFYSFKSQGADLINREFKNCNPFVKAKERRQEIIDNGKVLRLTSVNSDNCFSFDLPSSTQRLGFLIKIKARNLEGKSLLFSVINKNLQRPDLETHLPKNKNFTDSYFIAPPMEDYAAGYNLYFDNASIGNQKSINDLASIEVHPIPYRFLTSLKIEKNVPPPSESSGLNKLNVYNPNPSLYEIKLEGEALEPNSTLVLSQSYNPGWKAYEVKNSGLLTSIFPFIFSNELKDHVLVNNWANGWSGLSDSEGARLQASADRRGDNEAMEQPASPSQGGSNNTIVIVFLPQYLEYLGFLLLLLVPIYIFRLK